MGVGFLVGYGLAAMVKGESGASDYDRYEETSRSYAAQPILGSHGGPSRAAQSLGASTEAAGYGNGKHDDGPGFFEKLTSTPVYHKVKQEAGHGDSVPLISM